MAYPDLKGERDSSMPLKRWSAEASGLGCRGTRVIWRKLNCLNPNLQRCNDPSAGKTLVTGTMLCDGFLRWLSQPSGCGALPSEGNQGDEWDAYVTLGRTTGTNAGSISGREPQGDGVLVVVVGVASHQGGREAVHRAKGHR